MSEPTQSLVIRRSSSNEIKQQGISEGMRTLRDDGWMKVLLGVTTVEEVLRVSKDQSYGSLQTDA